MKKTAHITVGGEPFCNWTGTQAGLAIQNKVAAANAMEPAAVCCGHTTVRGARRIAQALRPHFRPGAVAVTVGACPQLAN